MTNQHIPWLQTQISYLNTRIEANNQQILSLQQENQTLLAKLEDFTAALNQIQNKKG